MKTLRIRTRLCLTLLMCMLFVGKSVAQEEGENLPMSFVYPEAYSELIGYDTKNFDLNMGLADCLLKNYEDAVPKLQRAAKQGEGLAMAVLGDLYARESRPPDSHEHVRQGHTGQVSVGTLLSRRNVPKGRKGRRSDGRIQESLPNGFRLHVCSMADNGLSLEIGTI